MNTKPKVKCCKKPDVKFEGVLILNGKTSREFHCFNCSKTWTEIGKIKE